MDTSYSGSVNEDSELGCGGFPDDPLEARQTDWLRRVVHLALAIYLAPVVVLVFVVGTVLLGVMVMVRGATWVSANLIRPRSPRVVKTLESGNVYRGRNAVSVDRGGRSQRAVFSRAVRGSQSDGDRSS